MGIGKYIDTINNFIELTQVEQTKLLAYFYCIVNEKELFSSTEIKNCFIECDLKIPANISVCFSKLSVGKNCSFIKKGNLYTFHRNTKKDLDALYLESKHSQEISTTLRGLLPKINSAEQKAFLEEAISCFEIKCCRAAILMSWLLAMDVLYMCVLTNHIVDFNAAVQTHGKYKKIKFDKKEDFSDIKESDFIELLRVSRIISGDIKKILDAHLNFRNTTAHPNTIIVKESKAISFIEEIVENIIVKFQ